MLVITTCQGSLSINNCLGGMCPSDGEEIGRINDPVSTRISNFTMSDKRNHVLINSRRTMQDRILGNTLVQLPKAHHKAIRVEFNAAEEILYQAVEAKFEELRNQDLEGDDPRKPMSYTFAQISFLRQ